MSAADANPIELIPRRLYWTVGPPPRNLRAGSGSPEYFSTDDALTYENFNKDFGPLNLGSVVKYCRMVDQKLRNSKKALVHFCGNDYQHIANSAFLASAYLVVSQGMSPEDAWAPLSRVNFTPFRDAIDGNCEYKMTILDCLQGLQHAIRLGWFEYTTFDVDTYDHYSTIEGGDLNWVVPGKFVAFTGPFSEPTDELGYPSFMPEDYVPIFNSLGVQLVVRLNRDSYDRRRFMDNGILHVDLYFPDGSCPPKEIVEKFLLIVEKCDGAVAVHCKAGLGRTGTLIGLWCMKWHGFPARAYIAWNRICRPGSILGPQQFYLNEVQDEMFLAGEIARGERNIPRPPGSATGRPVYRAPETDLVDSNADYRKEDYNQGDKLRQAKKLGRSFKSASTRASGSYGPECRTPSTATTCSCSSKSSESRMLPALGTSPMGSTVSMVKKTVQGFFSPTKDTSIKRRP